MGVSHPPGAHAPGSPRSSRLFYLPLAMDTEYMGGHVGRIELNEVMGAAPNIVRIREQIVQLVRLAGVQFEVLQRKVQPTRLWVLWIEVHHHQDYIAQIVGVLAETDQLRIVHRMKTQVSIRLQRG